MKKVLIIGGKGNGTVLGESILDANNKGFSEFQFSGFINDRDNLSSIDGYPVLGGIDSIFEFCEQDYYFVYSIYKFDDQPNRINLFHQSNIPIDRLITFIHPTAYIAPSCILAPGVFIMPNVSITSNTNLGLNCIVRPGSTIGHDNIIGDHVSISAGVSIGSCNHIGDGASFGLKSCLREYTIVGENSMLGMGAVLTKNLPSGELWLGNPAKFYRKANYLNG
jgi:sugar O-acyltransferase (sialic acid O-acetyltransferase NeuD family)